MFRAMPNNKKNPKTRIPSVEETNAGLDKEFSMQDSKMEESPLEKGDSNVLETSMQSSSSVTEQAGEIPWYGNRVRWPTPA